MAGEKTGEGAQVGNLDNLAVDRAEKAPAGDDRWLEGAAEVPMRARLADYFGTDARAQEPPTPRSLTGAPRILFLTLAVPVAVLLALCLFVTAAGTLSLRVNQARAEPDTGGGATAILPTATVIPTSSLPALAPTVTLSPVPAGDHSLVLLYNERGFYAWNPGQRDVEVSGLAFEAIKGDGKPAGYRFDGQRWAGYYPLIEGGKCDFLEIINRSQPARPGECRGANALLTPEHNDRMVFWLPREGISTFRVLWHNQEIGSCPVTAGRCEVQLP